MSSDIIPSGIRIRLDYRNTFQSTFFRLQRCMPASFSKSATWSTLVSVTLWSDSRLVLRTLWVHRKATSLVVMARSITELLTDLTLGLRVGCHVLMTTRSFSMNISSRYLPLLLFVVHFHPLLCALKSPTTMLLRSENNILSWSLVTVVLGDIQMLIILILPLSADILIPCLSMPGTSSSCTLLVSHDLRLAVWLSNPLYVFGADLCSDLLQCVFVFIESKDHALHVVAYLGSLFWLIRSSGTSQGTWLAPLDLLGRRFGLWSWYSLCLFPNYRQF